MFEKAPYAADITKRIEFVEWALAEKRGFPFIWSDYDEDDCTKSKGIFQSPLILATFSAHLKVTTGTGLNTKYFLEEFPSGAMVLTCCAVARALEWYKTGTMLKPSAIASENDFSEKTTEVNTLKFIRSVAKLSVRRWTQIVEAAADHHGYSAILRSVSDVDEDEDDGVEEISDVESTEVC
ncbi:hypothetical protein BV25DRAFT_1833716 [Artomyces pyxidatus]|uniref:Uncharacterized protein n=1 Tax=Artomyces pyxidatus TaxID=48021 RepID=A0ACB8SD56_9AGAM|nr:hypothetical protein BV25DRAFT_1833716 [Artomyces pyxidatus]